MPEIRLSVIIPAYNEEPRLGRAVEDALGYLHGQDYGWEIIVVDDGSRDGTCELVEEYGTNEKGVRLIKNDRNRGKGYSVKRGMLAAQGQYRLFTDADASTSLMEMDAFWNCFQQGFDVVIGSRSLPDSEVLVRQRWYREKMGRVFNVIVKALLMRGYIDTQCGFKAFTDRAVEEVFPRQTLDGFAFDVELLCIASARGMKVAQLPVRWTNHPEARVNPVTDSVKMFADLLKIRCKSWLGKYR